MALDELAARKDKRVHLSYGEERKIEALELIADTLIAIRSQLISLNHTVGTAARNASSGISRR